MEKMHVYTVFVFIVCAVVFYFTYSIKKKSLKILQSGHSYKEKKLVFSNIRDLYGFRFIAALLLLVFGVALGENIAVKGFFCPESMAMLIGVVLSALLGVYSHCTYRKLVDMC